MWFGETFYKRRLPLSPGCWWRGPEKLEPPSPSWCEQAVVDVDPVAAPPPRFAKRKSAALGSASRARARRRNVWKRFARARLKVSTGQFCRGSAGRAFGPAIKKSPGDIPRLSQCRLKPSVSRRVRPHLAYARSVEPSKWRDGAIAADSPAVLTRQSAYATLAVGFDREVSDIVPPSYFFEGAPTVGKKLPAPLEGELSEGAIISFLGTREGAALV